MRAWKYIACNMVRKAVIFPWNLLKYIKPRIGAIHQIVNCERCGGSRLLDWVGLCWALSGCLIRGLFAEVKWKLTLGWFCLGRVILRRCNTFMSGRCSWQNAESPLSLLSYRYFCARKKKKKSMRMGKSLKAQERHLVAKGSNWQSWDFFFF